jgi:hypothetical protein
MGSTLRCMSVCALAIAACVGCASAPSAPVPPIPTPPIAAGQTTIMMAQPPSAPAQTLPDFLGITGLFKAGGGCLNRSRNMLGKYFPGMEAKPAALAISDPANLESPSPAAAAAADVKAQEDGAEQKVKGIRYLAKVGCGDCYPDVEKALLAALDDCTEDVRFAGAQALRDAAGDPCQSCRHTSCCSPEVRTKLREIGCGIDEKTKCYKEPSARVRRMARLALSGCGCAPQQSGIPEEGPGIEDQPAEEPLPLGV